MAEDGRSSCGAATHSSMDLGPGESSVLAYVMAHRPMIAIIDDLSARHCAEVFRIPVSGTLGLVLTAKKRGVIPFARPALEHLRQSGMYFQTEC